MRVWTYVITHDYGSAPNYQEPATTLVICKPKIRKGAKLGDIVLAFNGARVRECNGSAHFCDPNTVRWAGIVSERLSLSDYWNDRRFSRKKPEHSARPDNIYQPYEDGYRQVANASHGPESHVRDISGRNALIFDRAWYFGRTAPSLPEAYGLWMGGKRGGGRQGHRNPEITSTLANTLVKWLDRQSPQMPELPVHDQRSGKCGKSKYPRTC